MSNVQSNSTKKLSKTVCFRGSRKSGKSWNSVSASNSTELGVPLPLDLFLRFNVVVLWQRPGDCLDHILSPLVTVKQDWPVRVKSISSPKQKWLRAMNSLHPLEKVPVPRLGADVNFTAWGSVSLGPRRCTMVAKLLL